jgi:glycosyltransferase involved in cell wall biosynthesis
MSESAVSQGEILVSICCLSYNHESYIVRAIEGFLLQKTNFAFEVLIHDDASTDRTAEIIKEYEQKYPLIIKPIYQSENQWSKGLRSLTVKYGFPRAKGKYIAICEGDDYWTDPLKLQKQVDFLENHPDYILCSGGYTVLNGDTKTVSILDDLPGARQSSDRKGFSFELMHTTHRWVIKTLTVMFRNKMLELGLERYQHARDVHWFYHLLKLGKGYYFKEDFGVYTAHPGGIQSLVQKNEIAKTAYLYYQELDHFNKDEFTRIMRLKSTAYLVRANYLPLFSSDNRQLIREYFSLVKNPVEIKWLVATVLKKHKKA